MSSVIRRFTLPKVTQLVLGLNLSLTILLYYLKLTTFNEDETVSLSFPMFQLIPSKVISHPWTLILSSFGENSLIGLTFSLLNTLLSIRYFEKIWGSKQTLKFLSIVSFLTNLVVSVIIILFSNDKFIINYSSSGSFTLIMAYIVAFKQYLPEHNLIFFKGLLHLRIKHVCFILILILTILLPIVNGYWLYYPGITSLTSFLIGWVYLRFFQSTVLEPLIPLSSENSESDSIGSSKIQGDASDTFAFVYFFPEVFHGVLSPIFNSVYQILSSIGLIPRFNEDEVAISNERAMERSRNNVKGRNNPSKNIAERRRQVALRVLEERIGSQ